MVRFPLYTEFVYIITQWSCSTSGSSWKMLDSNPGPLPQKSGALPMSHHISSDYSYRLSPVLLLATVEAAPYLLAQ